MASQAELTAMSKWAKQKGLRSRAQGIRRLVTAAMAIDDGYPRLQEAERLVQALREHVQEAVKIRLAENADPKEMDRLIKALVAHYPTIERAAEDLADLMRRIAEELKTENRGED